MTLDPRRLVAFSVFARTRNFTLATRQLHVTQPALHMQVRQLSEEAGTALYARRGAQLVLTEAGVRLAAAGNAIADQVTTAESALRGAGVDPVVLAAGEGALLHLLPRGIHAFLRGGAAPLQILTLDRPGALAAVMEGRAHVAVTSPDGIPRGLGHRVLCSVPQVIALPSRHVLARKRAVKLEELRGVPLVAPPVGAPLRAQLDAALGGATVVVEAAGWEVMLRCVEWGMGAAVVNGMLPRPSGVVFRTLGGLPPRSYAVFWHPSRDADTRVTALRDAIVQHVPRASRLPSSTRKA